MDEKLERLVTALRRTEHNQTVINVITVFEDEVADVRKKDFSDPEKDFYVRQEILNVLGQLKGYFETKQTTSSEGSEYV